jgi:hypothetical protein
MTLYDHTSMKLFFRSIWFSWTYLILLCLGYIGLGWLLAAYKVSWLIWLGTLLITIHLSIAETGAIFLANLWLVLVISLGIILNSKISLHFLPFDRAQIWALTLLIIWFFSISLIFMLALAPAKLKKMSLGWLKKFQKYNAYILVTVTWIAMRIGYLIYKVAS